MSAANELSFLPEDYLAKKSRRRSNFICASLFVVVMGTVVGTWQVAKNSLTELEKENADANARYNEAAKRIEQVQQVKDKQHRLARQAELTDSLLERVPRSNLLAELTNALPAGVSLIDFGMDSKVRAAPPPPPKSVFEQKKAEMDAATAATRKPVVPEVQPKRYDVTMRLSGVADNDVQVAQFITKLNACPLFRDVNLVITDEFTRTAHNARNATDAKVGEGTPDRMRRFQIELALRSDAEVTPAAEKRKTAAVELAPAASAAH
ncbi:MAG TPA: PilN domain-containing protein [Tepidisphaeraceae bacterium]|nr:PilN domain-containing protein [Tepidisphaeraceae bacterium]